MSPLVLIVEDHPIVSEILKLIADGLANQKIADKLFVSTFTVDSHRKKPVPEI